MRSLALTLLVVAAVGFAGGSPAGQSKAPAHTVTEARYERWKTALSNWGRWGKADQLGALNLITPAKRKQAAALVKEGIIISLAHRAVKEDVDSSPAFQHRMVALPREGQEIASAADEYSVRYHGFTQTHLDGLCHLIYKGKMYNGFSAEQVTNSGARKLGVENIRN